MWRLLLRFEQIGRVHLFTAECGFYYDTAKQLSNFPWGPSKKVGSVALWQHRVPLLLPEARYICRRFSCGAKGQASLRTLSVCASVHVGPRAEGRPSRTVQRIGERNFAAKTTRRHFQATPELDLQPHAASGRTRPCAAVRHDT